MTHQDPMHEAEYPVVTNDPEFIEWRGVTLWCSGRETSQSREWRYFSERARVGLYVARTSDDGEFVVKAECGSQALTATARNTDLAGALELLEDVVVRLRNELIAGVTALGGLLGLSWDPSSVALEKWPPTFAVGVSEDGRVVALEWINLDWLSAGWFNEDGTMHGSFTVKGGPPPVMHAMRLLHEARSRRKR